MSDLPLEERAWDLAKRNAKAIYNSPSFMLGSTSLLAAVGSLFAYLSWGGDPGKVLLGSLATGLGANLFCFASVLGFQVAVAPYRQRDDLRRSWRKSDRMSSDEIASRASGFARRGEDLLQACKGSGGYTRRQEAEIEEWTVAASDFLAQLEGRWAVEFSRASRGTGPMVAKLERRIEVLDALVETSAGESPVDAPHGAPA
jgi:hypothetical protein